MTKISRDAKTPNKRGQRNPLFYTAWHASVPADALRRLLPGRETSEQQWHKDALKAVAKADALFLDIDAAPKTGYKGQSLAAKEQGIRQVARGVDMQYVALAVELTREFLDHADPKGKKRVYLVNETNNAPAIAQLIADKTGAEVRLLNKDAAVPRHEVKIGKCTAYRSDLEQAARKVKDRNGQAKLLLRSYDAIDPLTTVFNQWFMSLQREKRSVLLRCSARLPEWGRNQRTLRRL